jgi:putative membrane protein
MMDWGDGGGWAWWWMAPMMLFMVALIGAVVWAVIAATRPSSMPTQARPTAEEILNERFARGEIDAADYREHLDVLHNAPTTKR